MRESKRELRRQVTAAKEGMREAREHLEGMRMSVKSIVRDAGYVRLERQELAAALVTLDTCVGHALDASNGTLSELRAVRIELYTRGDLASRVLTDHDAVRRMSAA